MTTDLIGNASGFELLFFASAAVGAWFSRLNFTESWTDYRALGSITNGRRAIAVATIHVETLLMSIHALYIIAALVAMSHPGRGEPTPTGVLIQFILVYASWAVTSISILGRRLRRFLLAHGLQNRDDQGRFVKATNGLGRDLEE